MKKTVLNSLKIKENLKNFDKIDYGCDYLILSYSNSIPFFDGLLFGVDIDNSNFGVIDINSHKITYTKLVLPNGLGLTFFVDYNGIPTPLFQYVKFNKSSRTILGKSAKVSIYGAYYRLESIGEFESHELIKYFSGISSEDPVITRYDFRIDYFSIKKYVPVPFVTDILGYIHTQSSITTRKKGGKLVDWRVGTPNSGKYIIRYYDKKNDTNNKDKWFLYTDFLYYLSVHRLEIQFGRAFCRGYSLSDFSSLERKIINVLGLGETIFNSNLFYQYNSTSEITLDNANTFIKRFNNLSDKLFNAGYSPFLLLEYFFCAKYGKDVGKGLIDDFINKSLVNELKSV